MCAQMPLTRHHTFCTHHTHIHICIVYTTHVYTYVHTTHMYTFPRTSPYILHISSTRPINVKNRLYLNPPLRGKKNMPHMSPHIPTHRKLAP